MSARAISTACGREGTGSVPVWLAGVLSACLAVGPAIAQEVDEPIVASVLRTWDPSGVTVVDGLANVPLSILRASTLRTYRLEITVLDGAGNDLFQEGWDREVSDAAASAAVSGTAIEESFRFGVVPGSYVLELKAFAPETRDIASTARIEFEAFGERPVASDLFLASRVDVVGDNEGGTWSVVRGGLGIAAAASPTVLANQPEIYYFLELYPAESGAWSASIAAELVRPDGSVLLRTPDREVEISAAQPFTGRIPLEGLPPGEYQLVMHVGRGTADPVIRAAAFRLRDLADVRTAGGGRDAVSAYLESISDEELEATFGAMSVVVSETERVVYEELPPDAKRRYLVDFFGRRDPTPLTAENEFFNEYVERVGVVRQRYSEGVGVGEIGPWHTARGRIYMKFGEPQRSIIEHFPADQGFQTTNLGAPGFAGEPPYEIWSYQQTGYVYMFVAEDRFGSWRLIYSTDPDVAKVPSWWQHVGNGALQDLRDNFGIRVDATY